MILKSIRFMCALVTGGFSTDDVACQARNLVAHVRARARVLYRYPGSPQKTCIRAAFQRDCFK